MASSELAQQMAEAANSFLEALSPTQREAAIRPFTPGGERLLWYYTPNARPGVSLIELSPPQRQLARRLVRTGMSESGYNTAMTIMGIEAILGANEGFSPAPYPGYRGPATSVVRDPDMYFMCVFGEPGDPDAWGWAFGGHHISLHHTVVGGQVARATPSFLGANPATSPLGEGHLLRPLAPEEDLGFRLLTTLTVAQRARAVISPLAPIDLMQANRPVLEDGATPLSLQELMGTRDWAGRQAGFDRAHAHTAKDAEQLAPLRFNIAHPVGLPLAALDASQRQTAEQLVRRYIERLPGDIAAGEWERIRPTLDATHFAWAGAQQPGQAHYHRIHGPELLIEYDNPDADGNHVHAVWRDRSGDFGADLLAAHYAAAHR